MANPLCTLELLPFPTTLRDLTALTGGSHISEDFGSGGFDDSDWYCNPGYVAGKFDGGGQLEPEYFGVGVAEGNTFAFINPINHPGITWSDQGLNPTPSRYGAVSDNTKGLNGPSGSSNWGIAYPKCFLNRRLHKLHWQGYLGGGTFTAEAFFNDGSGFAATPLALPTNGAGVHILCTYRGWEDGKTMTFRIRKTSGTGDQIATECIYKEPSLKPPTPRSFT